MGRRDAFILTLGVLGFVACVGGGPSPAPPVGSTRLEVTVTACGWVGYGLTCGVELSTEGPARLESCVGNGDPMDLMSRLTPVADEPNSPLSLWMDVERAPKSERYCGILILESGAHLRVVDFER